MESPVKPSSHDGKDDLDYRIDNDIMVNGANHADALSEEIDNDNDLVFNGFSSQKSDCGADTSVNAYSNSNTL